jgi:hypothetical protein
VGAQVDLLAVVVTEVVQVIGFETMVTKVCSQGRCTVSTEGYRYAESGLTPQSREVLLSSDGEELWEMSASIYTFEHMLNGLYAETVLSQRGRS